MDGHDNDENANNASSAQGGIFSTPDLTVDAEKIAQPTQANERKRVASIFANTDTGRQAQKLTDAMEAQTTPVTEDVVINNGGKKKKKWPIITSVIAALAVAMGFMVIVLSKSLTGQGGQSPKTPLVAFEDYRQFLIDGNSEEDTIDGDWLIFHFGDSGMNSQDMTKYASSVLEKFQSFLKLLDTRKTNLTTDIESYSSLLNLFVNVGNLQNLKQDLLRYFVDSGSESAYQYITTVSSTYQQSTENGNAVSIVADMLKEYLGAELSLIEQYAGWKCIDSYSISLECVYDSSMYSNTYTVLLQQQSKAYTGMISYTKALQAPFSEMTDSILNELKG